jgi:hypothetical protein
MSLRLNGSTSGYSEIDAPAIAGNNTLVLPTTNGSANQLLKNGSTPGVLEYALTTLDSSGNLGSIASINGGPLAGFRNRIINGNFDFWQRGASFTGDEYGADRWLNARVGSTHTATRQAFTLGQTAVPGEPTYFCRTVVVTSSGASNYAILVQRIEDVRTFAGQQVTVSFWAKVDSTKNIAVELVQEFGTGGSPSAQVRAIGTTKVSIGTSWQKVTVTATVPSISGKTLGTNGDSYLALTFWFDAGSDFNAFTDSLGQQSGTFEIAQVQIEPGAAATPFERRPIGTELALCQRYFCKSYQLATAPGSAEINLGNPVGIVDINLFFIACVVSFPVIMRTSPSVTIFRPSTGASGTVENVTETDPRTVNAIESGQNGIGGFSITSASPGAATGYQFQYTASAEL